MEDSRNATGTAPHTEEFLQFLMAAAGDIDLEPGQVEQISRLYFGEGKERKGGDFIASISTILTPTQYKAALRRFAVAYSPAPASAAPFSGSGLKDQQLVELDVAAKAAERLIGWAKIAGFVVAIPIGLAVVGLSFMGISKFQDVEKAANKANAILSEAQASLDSNQKTVRELTDRAHQVDEQLAKLNDSLAKNDVHLASLDNSVKQIFAKLKFQPGMTPELQDAINSSSTELIGYYARLGYKSTDVIGVTISDDSDGPGSLNADEVRIGKAFAREEIWLHWVSYWIVEHSNSVHIFDSSDADIGDALSFYFLASFRNEPAYQEIWEQHNVEGKWQKFDLGRIGNSARFGDLAHAKLPLDGSWSLAWSGTFWDIRAALGADIADKMLYHAWTLTNGQGALEVATSFIKNLMAGARSQGVEKAVRDSFLKRGMPSQTLE